MDIIRMGINGIHYHNYEVSRPNGYPHYLFLLIKTPAIFMINNEETKAESGTAIIYDINYPHHYSADNGDYQYVPLSFNT